jgi:transcriptional regulator with XRE-family HTH domain
MPKSHDLQFLQEIGRQLQNRREELGLSQTAIASPANITAQQLSRYELGLSDPPLSTLLRICKSLGINATALLIQTIVLTEHPKVSNDAPLPVE